MSDIFINALYSPTIARNIWLDYVHYGNTNGLSLYELDQIEAKWSDYIPSWEKSISADNNEYIITDDEFDNRINDGINDIEGETGVKKGGHKFKRWVNSGSSALDGGAGIILSTAATGDGIMSSLDNMSSKVKNIFNKGSQVGVNPGTKPPTATSQWKTFQDNVGIAEAELSNARNELNVLNTESKKKFINETEGPNAYEDKLAAAEKNVEAKTEELGKAKEEFETNKDASIKENTMAYIAIGIATATAIKYWATKPNKEEKEAVLEMQDTIEQGQNETLMAAQEMVNMEANAIALSDEAFSVNENSNNLIVEEKSDFDFYTNSILALQAKVETEGGLTEDEQVLYAALVAETQATSDIIGTIQTDTTETVNGINDEITSLESGFDDAATVAIDLQAITDYTGSFDKSTRNTCYVEGAGQAMNAYSGIQAAVKLLGNSGPCWWNYVIAAVGFAAGASSGVGAVQQMKYAGEISTEISLREQTEVTNINTFNTYDTTIVGYGSALDTVNSLELLIPEDMEAPVPETALPDLPEDDDDKKDEDDDK